MGLFKKNKRESEAAPQASVDMTPMVKMLAGAPEEQRRQMLKDRLAVFAGQDEQTRVNGMGAMLRAALTLPEDQYGKIASSRLAVLLDMGPDERMALMQGHAAAVRALDENQRAKEIGAMKSVVSQLPDPQKEMVVGMMQKLGMMP